MTFFVPAGQDLTLVPEIKGNDGPNVVAKFRLFQLDVVPPQEIAPDANGAFKIAGRPAGTDVGLRLDIAPVWGGATSADVSVRGSTAGAAVPNSPPPSGHPGDWICTLAKSNTPSGAIHAEALRASFN